MKPNGAALRGSFRGVPLRDGNLRGADSTASFNPAPAGSCIA
jgi:hypothetical protein